MPGHPSTSRAESPSNRSIQRLYVTLHEPATTAGYRNLSCCRKHSYDYIGPS
jgi:hypothetical protein